jgi:hypothetical protein
LPETELPSEVRQLIARHLSSMEHVDVLVLLAKEPAHRWSTSEIRERLRLANDVPSRVFTDLVASGLIAREPGDTPRYQYQPSSSSLREAVASLLIVYEERPVTLVRTVYSRPSAVQSFADAFIIKKKSEEE